MNGSKNALFVVILILALLPWGVLLLLLNSERGAEFLGIKMVTTDPGAPTPEEASERKTLLERQERKIADLEESLAEARSGESALITPTELRSLRNSLAELRSENEEFQMRMERLRTEYNSALSEVVRLKTQQMAAEAAPQPEPEPVPEESPARRPPAPNSGGWILPPGN